MKHVLNFKIVGVVCLIISALSGMAVISPVKASMQNMDALCWIDVSRLPEIDFKKTQAWFGKDDHILTPPPHDQIITIRSLPLMSDAIDQTIYVESKLSTAYVMQRGGLSDSVKWFGPVSLTDLISNHFAHTCKPRQVKVKIVKSTKE